MYSILFSYFLKDVKTIDLTMLLKLNNTGVVYSNVSWNPETLQAIKDFKTNAYNNLLEVVRNASNSTQKYLEKGLNITFQVLNQTVDVANTTFTLLNYTIYNPREALEKFRELEEVQKLVKKWNDAIQKVNDTIKDVVDRMDFTTVGSTINSFMALEEVQRFEETMREVIKKTTKEVKKTLNENIEKLNETIQQSIEKVKVAMEEFIRISKDPEHPINIWAVQCLDMTVYDISVKSYYLTTNYTVLAFNHTLNFSRLALNYTLNFTEWAVNNTKNYTQLALYKFNNYTVLMYNYTVNISKQALEFALNYSDEVRNFSNSALEYTMYYKDWALNKTELIVNVTRPYVIWVIEYSEPYRIMAVDYAQQLRKGASEKMVIVFKKSIEVCNASVKYTLIGYKKGMMYMSNATSYIIKISKDPEHILNRYAMVYLDGTIFQVSENAFYRVSNITNKWYIEAEKQYNEYYNKYKDFVIQTLEKLAEIVNEKVIQLEVMSKNESNIINIYMRKYFKKNLFEVSKHKISFKFLFDKFLWKR